MLPHGTRPAATPREAMDAAWATAPSAATTTAAVDAPLARYANATMNATSEIA